MSEFYRMGFRANEASRIIEGIDKGDCLSVIGAPSVGKTNFLRYIDQGELAPTGPEDPWALYTQKTREKGAIRVINIDPNALLPALPLSRGDIAARSWPGFELMIHRLTITPGLCPVNLIPGLSSTDPLAAKIQRYQDRFEKAHSEVAPFDDELHAHLALRQLEGMVEASLKSYQLQDDYMREKNGHLELSKRIRIVFVLDEFERILEALPTYFFVALRSLRDRFKYRVMFVTFTRNNLHHLAKSRMRALESFIELFHDHWIYLGPYDDDDSWDMILRRLGKKREVPKEQDHQMGLIIRATGGFAGLIRASFVHAGKLDHIAGPNYSEKINQSAAILCKEQNVMEECDTLLRSLNAIEIKVLYETAGGYGVQNHPVFRELCQKSLIKDGSPAKVFPPILAEYIRSHPTPPEPDPDITPPTLPE